MDVNTIDALIDLVAERPTIWNKRDQNHSCRLEVEKCWKEIGAALRVDENSLRKKWKYLRDQFCVELGKVQTSGTGAPKWRHFKALDFLRCTVTARSYGKDDDDSDVQIDEQSSSDYFERLSPKPERKKKAKSEIPKKKKKTSKPKYDTPVPKSIDNDSINDKFAGEAEDEHLHFFKSIIPHVRKIPEAKLLTFRGRMQSIVEAFAYGPNPTSTEFIPEFPITIKGSPPRYSSEAEDPIDTTG